ncbi:hypothetical protein Ancab_023782 [Ancistrocladus abbreviatus]
MTENEAAKLAVVEEESSQQKKAPSNNMPFLSLLPKLQFNLPFGKPQQKAEMNAVAAEEQVSERAYEDSGTSKPDIVRFPVHQPELPPLNLENEEAENSSNPLVLWQVYALGGFMIARWLWAKWQERKAKTNRKPSNEGHSPSND